MDLGYKSWNYIAWIRSLNNIELEAQADAYESMVTALYPHDWFDRVYRRLWRTKNNAWTKAKATLRKGNPQRTGSITHSGHKPASAVQII